MIEKSFKLDDNSKEILNNIDELHINTAINYAIQLLSKSGLYKTFLAIDKSVVGSVQGTDESLNEVVDNDDNESSESSTTNEDPSPKMITVWDETTW